MTTIDAPAATGSMHRVSPAETLREPTRDRLTTSPENLTAVTVALSLAQGRSLQSPQWHCHV